MKMSLSDTMGKLESLLSNLIKDLSKVSKGNRSAAQRVRVATIRMEKVGKQFRKESVNAEKSGKLRKTKKKPKKRKR
jgi:hypothetical protein